MRRALFLLGFAALSAAVVTGQNADPFTPARLLAGDLPLVPVRSVAGGQVWLEVSVDTRGLVSAVRTLRSTPPFTDALTDVVRRWQFRPADQLTVLRPGEPPRRVAVASAVFVGGAFRPPTLNTPTLGTPPQDVGSGSGEAPSPIASAAPLFPPLARSDGAVLVEVAVDSTGRTDAATVRRSSPPFDQPSLDAARQWSFSPARHDGQKVRSFAYLVMTFRQPVTPGRGRQEE